MQKLSKTNSNLNHFHPSSGKNGFQKIEDLESAVIYLELTVEKQTLSEIHNNEEFWTLKMQVLEAFLSLKDSTEFSQKLWDRYCDFSLSLLSQHPHSSKEVSYCEFEKELTHLEGIRANFEDYVAADDLIEISLFYPDLKKNASFYQHSERDIQGYSRLQQLVEKLKSKLFSLKGVPSQLVDDFIYRLSLIAISSLEKRNALIKKQSDCFVNDMRFFVNYYFENKVRSPYPTHTLKEKIKKMQEMAKLLTLDSHVLHETRAKLSEYWDQLRIRERNYQKQMKNRKVSFTPFSDAI